jgi:polyferredoxin
MKRLREFLPLIWLLLAAGAVYAGEFVPLPTFTHYEIPSSKFPAPRPVWLEWLDAAALLAGLSLATYLALGKRSRRGLFLLSIASLLWFGFWRKGCICPIGAIQNVTLAFCDSSYAVPIWAVVFFVLPLIFTLFFGRTFCAAVCPLGAVQELAAVRPVQTPAWLDHALGLFAYVYLGAAVLFAATGTAFVICRYDPFVGLFRLSAGAEMLILGGCFVAAGVFIGRPYCRYLCPYSVILGWLSKASKWHVRIPPEQCIQCRLCEEACPYGAIRAPTAALASVDRKRGRRRLGFLLLLLPMLIGLGAVLGGYLEIPLARLNPTVRLAERIRLEETGVVQGTIDASDAFRATGRPVEELYRETERLLGSFGTAGGWFGAWVGLVIGVKLVYLSIRRRRADFEPDRSNCVACGRCFWYCPEGKSG